VLLQIKPALCQVWRGPGTVQIGLDPRRGTLLSGLGPMDRVMVRQLAGGLDTGLVGLDTRPVGSVPSRRSSAGPRRGSPALAGGARDRQDRRTRQMIKLLSEAGVLVSSRTPRSVLAGFGDCLDRLAPDAALWSVVYPGPDDGWDLLAGRSRRCVRVVGAGRTGTTLVALLSAAGVGRLLVSDPTPVARRDLTPAGADLRDLGLPRSHAAARAALRVLRCPERHPVPDPLRVAGRPRPSPGRNDRVDLVVTVEHDVADAIRADGLGTVPHLPVVAGPTGTVVGPLVLPGRCPCLRCLDLHRRDRDPGWPRVLADLLSRRRVEQRSAAPEETTLSCLAAAVASLQVLAFLDGRTDPACLGAALEIDLPQGLMARRSWPAHPSCGRHRGDRPSGDHGDPSRRGYGLRAPGR